MERSIHAIWCDDMRQEVGNKPSFMGVYTNNIVFQSLPAVLHRLSIFSWISTPIDHQFEKLVIKVVRDDNFVLMELTPDIKEILGRCKEGPDDSTQFQVMTGMTLNGIDIPKDCKYLQILAETESEMMEGPKLRIQADTPKDKRPQDR